MVVRIHRSADGLGLVFHAIVPRSRGLYLPSAAVILLPAGFVARKNADRRDGDRRLLGSATSRWIAGVDCRKHEAEGRRKRDLQRRFAIAKGVPRKTDGYCGLSGMLLCPTPGITSSLHRS